MSALFLNDLVNSLNWSPSLVWESIFNQSTNFHSWSTKMKHMRLNAAELNERTPSQIWSKSESSYLFTLFLRPVFVYRGLRCYWWESVTEVVWARGSETRGVLFGARLLYTWLQTRCDCSFEYPYLIQGPTRGNPSGKKMICFLTWTTHLVLSKLISLIQERRSRQVLNPSGYW